MRMRPLVVVLLMVPVLAGVGGQGEAVSVADLTGPDAERWAGVRVTVSGELVGDIGRAGDGASWVQLNQDAYVDAPLLAGGSPVGGNAGIALLVPDDLLAGLDPPGRYRRSGPIVRVTGVMRWHDPDHLGDTFVAVESLGVVTPGRAHRQDPSLRVIAAGFGLLLLTGLLWPGRPGRARTDTPSPAR